MRVLALALLALLAPVAGAATTPSSAASLVVYHVDDPLASAAAPAPSGLAAGATRVDGSVMADPAPEGRPDSALAHFREYQRLVNLRRAAGAPVALSLGGALDAAGVDARAAAADAPPDARLRFVLVEDGVPYTTGEGARALRYVARDARVAEGGNATVRFPLGADAPLERLGVVAILETPDGEALQSATWRVGDEEIVSRARMVLVERATSTGCDACAPGDEAFALLASQVGLFDDARVQGNAYLRPATPLLVLGLLAGAAVGVVLLRRRAA